MAEKNGFNSTLHISLADTPAEGTDRSPELADVTRLARRALRGLVRAARVEEKPSLAKILSAHLGPRAGLLDVVEERWEAYEQVNVQAAIDAWLTEPGRSHEIVGITGFAHHMFGLADLLTGNEQQAMHGPQPGNVARANVPAGPGDAVMPCVRCGIYLVTETDGRSDRRTAIFVRAAEFESGMPKTTVQVVSTDADWASTVGADLRRLSIERNVFRGQVLSFGNEMFGHESAVLSFHERPSMREEDLILPPETIESVRRQVVGVATHRERLLAAGQHLKRGLLLHGPPGVGKTHTVRYLTAMLTTTTIIQLSGRALGMIQQACSVARSLQPSLIVVEDVDLIAEDRDMYGGDTPLLFTLLNEMDGLAEDADVVFLLTTNRADLLEPALAARPGRVDQAVEITLPDADARRRLFDLYKAQLDVDESRLPGVLGRTDGVTASFLKELLRRAAVMAAERTDSSDSLHVTADDLEAALEELMDTRNAMTRVLLGGSAVDTPN